MAIRERYDLIMAAQKYSEQEAHNVATLLCILDATDQEELRIKCERCLQAFINRKRLGTPFTFKQLRIEFGIDKS